MNFFYLNANSQIRSNFINTKEQTLMARKDKCTGPDRSLQLQAGIVVIMIIRGLLYPDGGGVFLLYIPYYKLPGTVKIVLRGLVRNDLNWGKYNERTS